eukprot:scaffold83687_cov56-Attheya_sp.AAC.4
MASSVPSSRTSYPWLFLLGGLGLVYVLRFGLRRTIAAPSATDKSRETSDSLSLMLPKSVRVLDMRAQGHSRQSGWREVCEMVLVGQHRPA